MIPGGDADPGGDTVVQICLRLANGGRSGRFSPGTHAQVTRALWEFAKKPESRAQKAMLIRGFHTGPGNFPIGALLVRSGSDFFGTVKASERKGVFRIGDPGDRPGPDHPVPDTPGNSPSENDPSGRCRSGQKPGCSNLPPFGKREPF
jgi:hypothetical protein